MQFSTLEHTKSEEKKVYLLCYPIQELAETTTWNKNKAAPDFCYLHRGHFHDPGRVFPSIPYSVNGKTSRLTWMMISRIVLLLLTCKDNFPSWLFLPHLYPTPVYYISYQWRKKWGDRKRVIKKEINLKILWNVIQIRPCYCSLPHSCMWLKESSIHNYSVIQWPWKYLKNTLSSWSTFLFCITKCSRSLYTHKYSINVLYLFLSRQAMYNKCGCIRYTLERQNLQLHHVSYLSVFHTQYCTASLFA